MGVSEVEVELDLEFGGVQVQWGTETLNKAGVEAEDRLVTQVILLFSPTFFFLIKRLYF